MLAASLAVEVRLPTSAYQSHLHWFSLLLSYHSYVLTLENASGSLPLPPSPPKIKEYRTGGDPSFSHAFEERGYLTISLLIS